MAQKLEDTQKKLEEVSQQKAAAERNVKYLQKNNAAGGLPLKEASSVITKANQAAQKVNAAVATTTNKRTLPGKGKNGAGNKKGQKKKAVPAAAPVSLFFMARICLPSSLKNSFVSPSSSSHLLLLLSPAGKTGTVANLLCYATPGHAYN